MTSATNSDPGKNSRSQESQSQDASESMHPSRPLHHLALRLGPVLLLGQQPDVRPLQRGGQMAVLGLGVPRAPTVPPAAVPPFLAGSPVACGSASLAGSGRGNRV